MKLICNVEIHTHLSLANASAIAEAKVALTKLLDGVSEACNEGIELCGQPDDVAQAAYLVEVFESMVEAVINDHHKSEFFSFEVLGDVALDELDDPRVTVQLVGTDMFSHVNAPNSYDKHYWIHIDQDYVPIKLGVSPEYAPATSDPESVELKYRWEMMNALSVRLEVQPPLHHQMKDVVYASNALLDRMADIANPTNKGSILPKVDELRSLTTTVLEMLLDYESPDRDKISGSLWKVEQALLSMLVELLPLYSKAGSPRRGTAPL